MVTVIFAVQEFQGFPHNLSTPKALKTFNAIDRFISAAEITRTFFICFRRGS